MQEQTPVKPSQSPSPTFHAPQVKVVNGKIVINEESLSIVAGSQMKQHFLQGIETETPREEFTTVLETTNHVTSSSYTNRTPSEKWTTAETDLFYK